MQVRQVKAMSDSELLNHIADTLGWSKDCRRYLTVGVPPLWPFRPGLDITRIKLIGFDTDVKDTWSWLELSGHTLSVWFIGEDEERLAIQYLPEGEVPAAAPSYGSIVVAAGVAGIRFGRLIAEAYYTAYLKSRGQLK